MNARLAAGLSLSLALALLVLSPAVAVAYHEEGSETPDETGYTMQPGEVRLGLWKLELGVPSAGGVTLGTYTLPWLALAAEVPLVNAYARVPLYHGDRWAVAATAGVWNVTVDPVSFWAVPLQVHASYEASYPVTYTLGAGYHYVGVRAGADVDDASLRGAVAVTNGQLSLTAEWRRGRRSAWEVRGRLLLMQEISGSADAEVRIDEFTRAEIHAAARTPVGSRVGGQVSVAWLGSWKCLNLRAGMAYGYYDVPGLHLVVPVALPMPELDLYVRF